ncbi:iron-sulfur cluster assembly 2 homolog, mitochondrial [Anopheles cruzii]|uniref:iron-sulfur cluster assembly 2 homolog, mitochondrial n=1 Tax=Anopheles cruzii TaxID=68878 RepID=UPI0022EC9282|nr:iron-sulfur cluster assembly 2 homolog, mitochondrial [Anopheles cruzii]
MNAIAESRLPTRLATLLYRFLSSNRAQASDTTLVQLSTTCVNRLKQICKNDMFLRVSVEGGGCSGFQYKFSIDTQLENDDTVVSRDGARVAIDSASVEYLNGATIDFHTELIRSGFRVISNPRAEQGCSCGASFAVKLD